MVDRTPFPAMFDRGKAMTWIGTTGRARNPLGDRAGFRDNAAFTSAGQRELLRAPHPKPGWRNW